MSPTRIPVLLAVALLGGVVGWALLVVVDAVVGRLLPVQWTAAVGMWILAIVLGAWTWMVRPRLRREPGYARIHPITAARTAALALAASRTGAAFTGLYLGIVVGVLPGADTPASAALQRSALGSASGALALTLIALYLESLCRIDAGDGDRDSLDSDSGEPEAA